jgi:RND superfamily putative drug exporter
MSAFARWCVRKRWVVVAIWLVAVVLSVGISRHVGSSYSNSFNLPGTETQKALDLLQANFPQAAGDLDQIVFGATDGKVTDPRLLRQEKAMLARVAALPHVVAVISPFDPRVEGQVSRDGTVAFAQVSFDKLANELPKSAIDQLIHTAQGIQSKYLKVELGGQGIEFQQQPSTSLSEGVGVLASAVVLFLAFGSWRGMITPIISAIAAILIGTSIEALLSQVLSVALFATQLSTLIGLGVGVDYALFIVSRHRNNLLHGMDAEESIVAAVNTSGRAVLFAAATVCVAILGMLLLNITFLVGVSLGTAMTVALTMIASLTLIPALLGFMGPKVLGRRRLARLEEHGPDDTHVTGRWLGWAKLVERRKFVSAGAAVAVMVIVALPFFSMRLGFSDAGNDPHNQTTYKSYQLLAKGFGAGFNGPLQVAVQLKSAGTAADLQPLEKSIGAQPGVAAVSPAVLAPLNHKTALFEVIAATSPEAVATNDLVKHLRRDVVPKAIAGTNIAAAYIGGATAAQIDFSHVVATKLPIFVAVVIVVASLLLMIAFRSFVIPVTASLMNILAAGATFGVLVFIFQEGHLGSVFTIGRPGPVDAFLPVMLFAILFGLSMDYQVFLVSRMHEEWIHTGDNRRAVTVGQAETGGVITAAASIMIVVFMAFVFGGFRVISEFGLGLAAAVLIDAFILRTVLVPSLMHALGNSNWYIPRWLDRILPHLSIEPPDRTYDDDLTLSDFERTRS